MIVSTLFAAALQATGPAAAPVPRAPLASLVSVDDYPAQAAAAGQSGTVRFRVNVATSGRVDNCTILQSSRSSILDASTCRIIRARARFTPARNAAGRAVAAPYDSEITWRRAAAPAAPAAQTAPAAPNGRARLAALTSLWTACVTGEAARRALTTAEIAALLDAAEKTCAEMEPVLLAEMAWSRPPGTTPADAMRSLKAQSRARLNAQVGAVRALLATPPTAN